MRCIRPRTVGFQADGRTLAWSQKSFSKEYSTFLLPCGKCIPCRLQQSLEKAVRCVHEASVLPKNSFVTLTYDDAHLQSPWLIYSDFQNFLKRLRRSLSPLPEDRVGYLVVGEYGKLRKRPHWHVLLFNWRPSDPINPHVGELGQVTYQSKELDDLWENRGFSNFGDVTFESAAYCARYAAKKLVHGYDGHQYEPLPRMSTDHAIGKRWLERYWPDVFNYGECYFPKSDGSVARCAIPRYYEKWLQKHHPSEYFRYVTETKPALSMKLQEGHIREVARYANLVLPGHGLDVSVFEKQFRDNKSRQFSKIIKDRFNRLKEHTKL